MRVTTSVSFCHIECLEAGKLEFKKGLQIAKNCSNELLLKHNGVFALGDWEQRRTLIKCKVIRF